MVNQEKHGGFFRHWPAILLGAVVSLILIFAIFTFQVNENTAAVVTTFGRVSTEAPQPGLHFRWPFPVEKIYKFDKRSRAFTGTAAGAAEEILTSDGNNIVVSIFVVYHIADPVLFFETVSNMSSAEQRLNDMMRSAKSSTFGRFPFSALINPDPAKMRLNEISEQMRAEIALQAEKIGLAIERVGINSLNVPGKITEKIFERMRKEREVKVQEFRSQGEKQARNIRTEAQKKSSQIVSDAEAQAREIRAEGDAEAAQYYREFSKNPELAEFLRSLESMRQILRTRTTLVLDTATPPFDLLNGNALGRLSGDGNAPVKTPSDAGSTGPSVSPSAYPAGGIVPVAAPAAASAPGIVDNK